MDELLDILSRRELSIANAIQTLVSRHEVSMPTVWAAQHQESFNGFEMRWVCVTPRLGREFYPLDISRVAGGPRITDENLPRDISTDDQKRRAVQANAFRSVVWPFISKLQSGEVVASGLAKRQDKFVAQEIPKRIWREEAWMIHFSGIVKTLSSDTDRSYLNYLPLHTHKIPYLVWEDKWASVKVKRRGLTEVMHEIEVRPEKYPAASEKAVIRVIYDLINELGKRPNLDKGTKLVREKLNASQTTATDKKIRECLSREEFKPYAVQAGRPLKGK